MQSHFIKTDAALADFCQAAASAEFLAIDTEFVRERTYYPQLALIQIAIPEQIVCIDPLSIKNFEPLKTLFLNPDILKVLHAAGQDMEIFYYLFGELPKPTFDTQIAATVLGFGEQIGYAALVQKMLNVELDKSHSRTDWLQRPLDPKQISYAEDDVRYLHQLFPKMRQQLDSQGRTNWLDEDFAELCSIERYKPNPETVWRKVKGLNKLKGVQFAILQKLAAWREEQAMQRDMPRRRVIGDDILLDVARLRPKAIQGFNKIRGLSSGHVKQFGETLISLIKEAEAIPKESWPSLPRPKRLTHQEEALADALTAIVKLCAHQFQISPASIAGRKELEQLLRGEKDLPILHGWRLHHGGKQLLEFIDGRSQLAVTDNGFEIKH